MFLFSFPLTINREKHLHRLWSNLFLFTSRRFSFDWMIDQRLCSIVNKLFSTPAQWQCSSVLQSQRMTDEEAYPSTCVLHLLIVNWINVHLSEDFIFMGWIDAYQIKTDEYKKNQIAICNWHFHGTVPSRSIASHFSLLFCIIRIARSTIICSVSPANWITSGIRRFTQAKLARAFTILY